MNINGLALYTDGKYKELALNGLSDYQTIVKGNIEWMPVEEDAKVSCYVNEEGMIRGLPQNPWTPFLASLGVILYNGSHVMGNIILLGQVTDDGDDTSIGASIVAKAAVYAKKLQ